MSEIQDYYNKPSQLTAEMSKALVFKDNEIAKLHQDTTRADNERDEAVQRADKLETQLRESLERYEKDMEAHDKAFSSIKEQRDSLARIAYLQTLEGSE